MGFNSAFAGLISRWNVSRSEEQLSVILNKRDVEIERFKMARQGEAICE
jgi:hypothetical protein